MPYGANMNVLERTLDAMIQGGVDRSPDSHQGMDRLGQFSAFGFASEMRFFPGKQIAYSRLKGRG